eukprot:gnl/TRDRNA2_/TRDRNA2_183711_c0_seq1.p1 gnl/TRDRNA2_/TRDRNA2_183711_c0~~gnl/TRDRNA2_/TRDRNA2_183711_c0_seq1.p1  ORF type:complete len:563 (-),score=129.93 gnl/TRDRNA2_/TRDRNA2_183711_c0_seq1:96-1784(-)
MAPARGARGSNKAAAPCPEKAAEKDKLNNEVEAACKQLFMAYDIDESGELSREEFVKLEMRICFEQGDVFKENPQAARLTLADTDNSGALSYDEFRERQLRNFQELGYAKAKIIETMNEQARRALTERQKMGPRFHDGIRKALKRIFNLYDVSGDGNLSPEEWIAAQRIVAAEISDELDDSWIDEKAFACADTNGDGMLSQEEFLENSFSMFEGVKQRTDALLATLHNVIKALENRKTQKETEPVTILVQTVEKPEFQPPHAAWQDEATLDNREKNSSAWKDRGELKLPLNIQTQEEVVGLVRLFLGIPADTWISVYFLAPAAGGGTQTVTLLRGEKPGEGNIQDTLEYLSKPNSEKKLYVKNVRARPKKLTKQPVAFLEERDVLLPKKVGQSWGLDWETQLVGDGSKLPPFPLVVSLGDAIVVEVPQSDESGEYRYACAVYMDKPDVLSKPIEEDVVVKAKKKKGKAAGPEPDPMLQYSFIAQKEGQCIMFVDLSWEDQETKLATSHKLATPVAENSVARVGPIQVDVQKRTGTADKSVFQWWNGEKWTNKKGPAKKKKKR